MTKNNKIITPIGNMRAAIEAHDWSMTSLGKPDTWSQCLKSAVHCMLYSQNPVFIWWGRDLIQLHNDAYLALFPENQNIALGESAYSNWSAVWTEISPIVEKVSTGAHVLGQDLRVFFNNFTEAAHWAFSYHPIFEVDGSIGGIMATGYEVPEIKLAQSLLKENEERLRLAVEIAELGTWDYNPSTDTILCSDRTLEIFGFEPDTPISLPMAIETIHEKDRLRVIEAIQHALQPGSEGRYDIEYRLVNRQDQAERIIRATGQAFFNDQGIPYRFLGTVMDFTERQRAEEAIRNSEERYRAFVSQSSEAIWRFELEKPLDITLPIETLLEQCYQYGYLAECNDAMAQMYGFTKADEIIGARLGDLLPADNEFNIAYLRAFVESGYRLTEAESQEVDRNGQPRFFLNNLIGIIENGLLLRAWGTQRDITEKKQSEKILLETKNRLELSLTSGNFGTWTYNPQSGKHWSDARAKLIHGNAPDEETSFNQGLSQVHPDDQQRVKEVFANAVQNRTPLNYEYRYILRNGEVRWIASYTQVYQTSEKDAPIFFGIVQDITTRKQLEQEFQSQFEELETIYRTAPIGLDLIDSEFRYIRINDQLAASNGLPIEAHIGRPIWEIVPDIADQVIPIFQQVFATGEPVLNIEVVGETKSQPGVRRTWINHFNPIKDTSGKTVAVNVLVEEITERKRAEEALRESQETLQLAMRSSRMGTWVRNIANNEVSWSPELEALFGLPPGGFGGFESSFFELIYEPDRTAVAQAVANALAEHRDYIVEFRFHHSDGSLRWMEGRGRAVYAKTGEPLQLYGIGIDITERKRIEQNNQFLFNITEELAHLSDPTQMMATVGAKLSQYLNASRCTFTEYDLSRQISTVTHDWHQANLKSTVGVYQRSSFFNEGILEQLNSGKPLILNDAENDPRTADRWQSFQALQLVAMVTMPYVSDGICKASLTVAHSTPHEWNSEELYLIQEVSDRVWSRIERTRAEAALRESENQLRLVTDAMPALISYVDKNHVYKFVNKRYTTWFGVEKAAIEGKHLRDVLGDIAYEAILPNVERVLSGQEINIEQLLHYKNAGSRYVRVNYVPDIQSNGEIKGWYALVQDITDRKKAEERYRSLFTSMQEGLLVAEIIEHELEEKVDFRYLDMNPAAERILGISREQVVGKTAREIIPNIQEDLVQLYIKVARTGEPVSYETYESLVNQYHQSFGFQPAPGQVAMLFWDITERKKAEEALVREREQLAIALRTGQMGVYEWKVSEDSIWWSPEVYPVYGVEPASFTPTTEAFNAMLHPDDREELWRKTQESIAQREVFEHEYRIILPDGMVRWIFNRSHVGLDSTGQVERITGVAMDITERKAAENRLKESEERLRRAMEVGKAGSWDYNLLTGQNLWSDSHFRLFGYEPTPDSIASYDMWYNCLHPEDAHRVATALEKAWDVQQETRLEYRILRADTGELRWFDSAGGYFHNEKGEPIRFVGVLFDITERKNAEEAMRESNERYHTLFNSIDEGFCICEMLFDDNNEPVDYLFLEVNPMYKKLTGLSDPVGKTGRELEPNLEEKWFQIYGDVVKTGEAIRFESHLAAWDKWYDLYVSRIGQPEERKFAILFNDITERKQAEVRLRTSEAQLQHLANAMPQLVWIANAEGVVTYYNDRANEYSGITQNAEGIWTWEPVLHSDDLQPTIDAWETAIRNKEPYVKEHRIRMNDGSLRWHLSRGNPVFDAQGNIIKWYGTATDIDDVKRAEQEIIESRQRFEYVANTVPVLIWQAGLDKGCYYFNQGWLTFTGRTLEQEQGNGWAEGVHPDDFERCVEIYSTAFDKQETFSMEYRLRYHDGTYRWIYDRGIPTYDHYGLFTGYMGGCIDIHERKVAEEHKDAFIRIAGHELRTPLTSLLGYLNLMQKSTDNSSPIHVFLQKSFTSALKMRGLINDFLFVANTVPGQFSYKITEFDFDELINETVEMYQTFYPNYQIELHGKTHAIIAGDHSRLEQVVSNLLNNAIKYSTDQKRVDVFLQSTPDHVILQVKDYGIGINPEDMQNIFERFFRANNVSRIRGMGLGLFIVKEILTFHHGKVEVESQMGEGTIFTVTLPIRQPELPTA
ncbi:MAG: PAS domain S-box protein [Saprospiraceae bacterium]